jgi:flagellar motor protein MotB
MRNLFLSLGLLGCLAAGVQAAKAPMNYYNEGVNLYNSGRFSESIDAFETAVKRKDRPAEAQKFIDRIRKETVERIRNRALTGVSKTTWQTKYYFIRAIGGRVRVGISSQEMFERQSLNFRQGAVDALVQLSTVLQQNDNAQIDIELISEINQDTQPNPDLLSRQLSQLFSFLSLSSQNLLPKY